MELITIQDKRSAKVRGTPAESVDQIRWCQRCKLADQRIRVVMGEGPHDAKIVFVGEAPGANEDRTGRPFQGEAGQVFNALLEAAGIDRRDAFVTNAVRCRPIELTGSGTVKNGKPVVKEIKQCRDNLWVELAELDPYLIVPLGDVALYSVTGKRGITKYRGEMMQVNLPTRSGMRPVKVLPTYHPAAVLYDQTRRPFLAGDLRRACMEGRSPEVRFKPPSLTTYICRTPDEVGLLVDVMLEQELVAFDTETSGPGPDGGLDMRVAKPICVSFAFGPDEGWVVPIRTQLPAELMDPKTYQYDDKDLPWYWTPEEWEQVRAHLARFFVSQTPKTAHHSKFDINVLHTIGIEVNGVCFDSLVMHACVDEVAPHSLEELRATYTDIPRYEGWKDDRKILPAAAAPYSLVPTDILWNYAGADSIVSYRCTRVLDNLLDAEGEETRWVFENVNMPLSHALAVIERNGMHVSVNRLFEIHNLFTRWIGEERDRLYELTGPFNYRSPKQLAEILFNPAEPEDPEDTNFRPGLGLPIRKVTAKGNAPSTDADAMADLLRDFPNQPVLKAMQRLRKLEKQRDTYLAGEDGLSGLLQHIDPDAFIHSTFNMFPRTGRLSSSRPNLHNITKKSQEELIDTDDEGALDGDELAIRSIFAAPPGMKLIEADYSQLELRIQAEVTREPILLEAFASGESVDNHKLTAAAMFNKAQADVTPDERNIGKRVNFASGYGGGVPGVMRAAKCTEAEAKEWVDLYRKGYPFTTEYRKKSAARIFARGYIENCFGRRRRFPLYAELREATYGRSSTANKARQDVATMDRQGYNHVIQSTGSDVLSIATVDVVNDQLLRDLGATVNLTLHDALYLLAPAANAAAVGARVKYLMEDVARRYFDWNLPVDVTWGDAWGDHEGTIPAMAPATPRAAVVAA